MRLGLGKWSLSAAAVSLGTAALLVAGCGASSGPSGPTDLAASQVFNYNLSGVPDIATADPDITTDSASITVVSMVFDGLVVLDKDLNVEKWGAKSVDISSDGLTYTFHLRDGQSFSNGKAVTSKDYAYSIDRSLNPCLASPVSYYLWEITNAQTFSSETCKNGTISAADGQTTPVVTTLIGSSILTPDDKTLVLKLFQPAAYFLEAMTYPTSFAIDQTVVGSDITSEKWLDSLYVGTTGQGGSGMYYISSWDHNAGHMVLKQNPHWWGLTQGKKPYLTEVDFTFFKDADTGYAAYQAGQFDIGSPTAQLLAQAKTQPDFHTVPLLTYFGWNMNWKTPPFDNLDARVAFCLAIDRNQLNTAILKSAAIPGWHIVPKGMPGYQAAVTGPDGVTDPSGDATKAKAHWTTYVTSLGSAKPAPVTFLYVSTSTTQKNLAAALQGMWKNALGVDVALKGEDFNTWLKDSNAGNFQLTRFGWIADYPDPQDFLTLLFASDAQYNSQKGNVPAADTLMKGADANSNQTQRIKDYNQAEQLLINAVVTCPGYQTAEYYQLRTYVNGFTIDGQGATPLDSWVSTYIKKH